MSSLSADWQTLFSKLGAECLPLSHCTTCGDLRAYPQTLIARRIPWKEVFSSQISRCPLQNPKRFPLIGGLGIPHCVLISRRLPAGIEPPRWRRYVRIHLPAVCHFRLSARRFPLTFQVELANCHHKAAFFCEIRV